jgi:hypothetical protein
MNKKILLSLVGGSIFISSLALAANYNCYPYPANSRSREACDSLSAAISTAQENFDKSFNNTLSKKFEEVYSDLKKGHKRGDVYNSVNVPATAPPQRFPQQPSSPIQQAPRSRIFY